MLTRISAAIAILLLLVGCNRVEDADAVKPPEVVEPSPEQGAAVEERPGQEAEPQPDREAEASDALRRRDYEGAVRLAEEALAANPQDAGLLLLLSRACESRAFQLARSDRSAANSFFLKGADYLRDLREVAGPLDSGEQKRFASALYNAACAHAIDGNGEKALASLREAFAEGFPDIRLAETDPDLAALREMPEFGPLIVDARQKLMERLREEARRQLAENEPFAFSFALPDTKGDVISLSDFTGKVVIVDLWGTWCPPCRKEVPHFIALRAEYGDQGLEVVGVNYERGPESEWIGKIESFITENGITYPCVVGDAATQDMVPEFLGYPTTLFIDRSGAVRLKLVGYHPYEELEAIVLELLAG